MSGVVPYEQWTSELQRVAAALPQPVPRIFVVREVDSTQDEARRRNATTGDVIVAWRQTSGRGRLGRVWADTGGDGAAMTIVMPVDRPERMAISAAVGVAGALETIVNGRSAHEAPRVGIKWPNDIMVCNRKIGGLLIEQFDHRALVGIGVNVTQRHWPADLSHCAISLTEAGVVADRIEVIRRVLQHVLNAASLSDDVLTQQFLERDVLVGRSARFFNDGRTIEGQVLRVDPLRGLAVRGPDGEVWLPAATTSVELSQRDSVVSMGR